MLSKERRERLEWSLSVIVRRVRLLRLLVVVVIVAGRRLVLELAHGLWRGQVLGARGTLLCLHLNGLRGHSGGLYAMIVIGARDLMRIRVSSALPLIRTIFTVILAVASKSVI